MEFSTVYVDVEAKDVRPTVEYGRYLDLLRKDIPVFYPATAETRSSCPVCKQSLSGKEFTKFSFEYVNCASCGSIVSKRIYVFSGIEKFFLNSDARKHWLSEIWTKSNSARLEKMYTPLINWIEGHLLDLDASKKLTVGEFLPNQPALMETWPKRRPNDSISAIASCLPKRTSLPNSIERVGLDSNQKFDLILSVDGLNRFEDPERALSWVSEHLAENGMFGFTATLSTGVEVMELGEGSQNLLPPDRLCLPSYEGLARLAEAVGFEVIEFSTPGMLDVSLLRQGMADGAELPKSLKYVLENRNTETELNELQEVVQKLRLSSLGRVLLRKRNR